MKLKIEQDQDNESPREWDNIGTMVCLHKRYKLGDEHDYKAENYDGWDALERAIKKEEGDLVSIIPLHLFDHGGISISTGTFACSWDSGQVGFIFARRADVLKEYSKKRLSTKIRKNVCEQLEAEVKVYDQFLTGDVWGYVVEDSDGEQLDSCWGIYGHAYCEQEGQEALEYYAAEKASRAPTVLPAPVCCMP